jgi:selenide,water dikinase
MDPPANARLQVVLDRSVAVYSGMVPGFVAGKYTLHELEIDVLPLARRAKAGVILSAATDLDPVRKEITIEGRPAIRFDLASLDVGSTVRGLELPGVSKHTLATRPIGRFVRMIDARLAEFDQIDHPPRILIVGGGAAGTELAFTIDARLRRAGIDPAIAILTTDEELLAESSRRTRRVIRREATTRGFETIISRRVIRADATGVVVEDVDSAESDHHEIHLQADLVVWATGASPMDFPRNQGTTGLSRDSGGFLEVRDTLQSVGFDDVFAAGDCARLVNHPWVPRAGVYAVRQGPILDRNLRARLDGKSLTTYRPQRDFLSLLYLGEQRALGSKWGLAGANGPLFRLKDWIDRRFMSRFQVLDEVGHPRVQLAELGAMKSSESGSEVEEEMACGGCAAKLGAEPLSEALARLPIARPDPSVLLGLDARDDVATTRDETGRMTLHNVDVIRSFCDDPWLVGRVAASNALSDVFAKGGRPRYAQAVIGLPDTEGDDAQEILFQALSGIRQTLDELDVSLLGGHTTIGEELTVGLSVTGDGPADGVLLRQAGARAGDDLLLSGPLGTGVVLAADRMGLARGEWVAEAHAAMQHTNDLASRIALEEGTHAATDVTGFGLAGHLLTLLEPDDLIAHLERPSIPFLPGATLLWASGQRSTAHPANRTGFLRRIRGAKDADEAWLFDPQTAGGLLLAVAPEKTRGMIEAFAQAGEPPIVRIGRLSQRQTDQTDQTDDAGQQRGRIVISEDDSLA